MTFSMTLNVNLCVPIHDVDIKDLSLQCYLHQRQCWSHWWLLCWA